MKCFFFLSLLLLTAGIFAQNTFNVPYFNDFNTYTSEEDFLTEWSFENNPPDAGAGVWLFDYTAYFGYDTSNCPLYFTASDAPGDDWLFSPGFNLIAGTNYTLSFQLAGAFDGYTEKMKVYAGDSDTSIAMTQLLHDYNTISSGTFTLNTINFSVPNDGVYHIGLLAYSDAGNFGIIIDNFDLNLANGVSESSCLSSALYPNPADKNVTIEAPEGSLYRIYNPAGKLVTTGQCINSHTGIDLANFAPGVYTVYLQNNDKSSVIRLMTF